MKITDYSQSVRDQITHAISYPLNNKGDVVNITYYGGYNAITAIVTRKLQYGYNVVQACIAQPNSDKVRVTMCGRQRTINISNRG